jgi:hypothetical protein
MMNSNRGHAGGDSTIPGAKLRTQFRLDNQLTLRHVRRMAPITRFFLGLALATLAVSIVAAPFGIGQLILASRSKAVQKLPVLDVFPIAKDDGHSKFLVMITNKFDEKIVPLEFAVLTTEGLSAASQALPESTQAPIAPDSVGVLFTEYAIPQTTEKIVTMMARIRYLGAADRTETLFVTRRVD